MLYVPVNIWPGGDFSKGRDLAALAIANTGTHPLRPAFGNYVAVVVCEGEDGALVLGDEVAIIDSFRRDRGPLQLIMRAITELEPLTPSFKKAFPAAARTLDMIESNLRAYNQAASVDQSSDANLAVPQAFLGME